MEHEGQLICGACLARKTARSDADAKPKRLWPAVGNALSLASAVLLLWLCFYGLGGMLLRIPPEVHDGTVWGGRSDKDDTPD